MVTIFVCYWELHILLVLVSQNLFQKSIEATEKFVFPLLIILKKFKQNGSGLIASAQCINGKLKLLVNYLKVFGFQLFRLINRYKVLALLSVPTYPQKLFLLAFLLGVYPSLHFDHVR